MRRGWTKIPKKPPLAFVCFLLFEDEESRGEEGEMANLSSTVWSWTGSSRSEDGRMGMQRRAALCRDGGRRVDGSRKRSLHAEMGCPQESLFSFTPQTQFLQRWRLPFVYCWHEKVLIWLILHNKTLNIFIIFLKLPAWICLSLTKSWKFLNKSEKTFHYSGWFYIRKSLNARLDVVLFKLGTFPFSWEHVCLGFRVE